MPDGICAEDNLTKVPSLASLSSSSNQSGIVISLDGRQSLQRDTDNKSIGIFLNYCFFLLIDFFFDCSHYLFLILWLLKYLNTTLIYIVMNLLLFLVIMICEMFAYAILTLLNTTLKVSEKELVEDTESDEIGDGISTGNQNLPTRNAVSVLRRLYNILDRRSQVCQ